MSWQTWTRFTAVVLFLIAVGTFYFNYLDTGDSLLSIENYPSNADLDSLDLNEDISYSFFLYNSGDGASFIERIVIDATDTNGDTKELLIEPDKDFNIDAGGSQEITVTLPAPGEETTYSLATTIYTTKEIINAESLTATWGTIL
tara:strand:+ start:4843 stop:5277 length:435 start_codon:yes stop_codon:yes gene_type:complete